MASINTSSDIQSKPNFAFNFASSLGNMLNNGGTIDGMFANLLSQTQQTNPPSPPPSNNEQVSSSNDETNNDASNSSNINASSDTNSSSSNVTNTNTDQNSSNNTAASTPSSQTPQKTVGWSPIGKPARHQAKSSNDKNDQNTAVAANNTQQTPAPDNNATSTGNSAQPVTNSAISPVANAQTDTSDTNNAAEADVDPDPNADTIITANIGTAPATTTPPTSQTTTDPAILAAAAAAAALINPAPDDSNSAPATGTSADGTAQTNIDPSLPQIFSALGLNLSAPTPSSNDPSTTGNSADNTDPTAPAGNNDVSTSQLMMLLMQLERLASSQAAVAPLNTNTDPSVTANVAATANAGTATSPATIDPGKIDLKALLSAVAKLESDSVTGDANGQTVDPTTGDTVNLAPASAANPAAPQNTLPASNSATSQDTSKLLSADFLNLFGVPASNPNSPATLPVFNPGVTTGAMIDDNGGASLDADTQGQNDLGAHTGTPNLLPNASSLLPTSNLTQASSPYDFASQLSAMRATQGGTTGLPAPIDQVILQMSRGFAKDGSSQMSIQLRPAELGRVDVKLMIDSNGKVQGTVTADNPSTLNLLLKDVRGLERALQEAGLRADSGSLQFGLRGDGQAGSGSNQTGNPSGLGDAGDLADSSTVLPGLLDQSETYYLTPGGVNMRV